jgi:hypothetical protein
MSSSFRFPALIQLLGETELARDGEVRTTSGDPEMTTDRLEMGPNIEGITLAFTRGLDELEYHMTFSKNAVLFCLCKQAKAK